MTKETITMKIVKLTETDWKKYPTYEHMIEEWVTEIIDEVTKEHNEEVNGLKLEIENLRDIFELYKATAEPKIKELKDQIEKMKCCNNCKYRGYISWKSKCCFDMSEVKDIKNPVTCKCDKWELAE